MCSYLKSLFIFKYSVSIFDFFLRDKPLGFNPSHQQIMLDWSNYSVWKWAKWRILHPSPAAKHAASIFSSEMTTMSKLFWYPTTTSPIICHNKGKSQHTHTCFFLQPMEWYLIKRPQMIEKCRYMQLESSVRKTESKCHPWNRCTSGSSTSWCQDCHSSQVNIFNWNTIRLSELRPPEIRPQLTFFCGLISFFVAVSYHFQKWN